MGAQKQKGMQASVVGEFLLCFQEFSLFSKQSQARMREGRLTEDAGFPGKFRARSRDSKGNFLAGGPPKIWARRARTELSPGSSTDVGALAPRSGLWRGPEKLKREA